MVIDPTPFTGIEIKEVATKVARGVDETDRVRPCASAKDARSDAVTDLWTRQRGDDGIAIGTVGDEARQGVQGETKAPSPNL